MTIILRALATDPWTKVFKYKNCYEGIYTYYTRSGRRYTGLSKEDQERLEKELQLDLRPESNFWDNFIIKHYGKDLYFDLNDPMDELKYTFCKNHKRCSDSIGVRKPTANFVLINQESEAKEINSLNRVRRRAIIEFGKMTSTEIKQCLRILGFSADSMSSEVAEAKLSDYVEANAQKFLDKWVDNKTKDTEYLIGQAVAKNILRKNKTVYKYGSDVIGYTLEDTVTYLNNPLNQDIKKAIMSELEIK